MLIASAGHAAVVPGETDPGEPWRMTADEISFDPAEERFIARGNVAITHLDSLLKADRISFNRVEMTAHAFGNVFFAVNGDTLTGDELTVDLLSETGTLYRGLLFVEETHFYIKGDRITKTGEYTYNIKQAGLTSCSQTVPDWSITGSNVNVTLEGYATVRHAAFRIRETPVFYVPFFVFPAKTKRQSGFLYPHLDYSARNGFGYMQPYFWAITDHQDATVYYHHIQKRGEKLGFEYRYMLSDLSRGTLMFDGFRDRRVDDDPDDPDRQWGYTGDGLLRPNAGRYWFRMKADQALPADVMARFDLDVVSDQDYLRDFRHGYTGHSQVERNFESDFDRGIDDRNDPVRENRLNLNRTWTTSSLNTDLIWYDDVVKRRLQDENDTLQRLPMISYNALKQPFYHPRLYGSLNTEYNYFFREDGVTGHRADLHPRLSLPLYPLRHFTLEPSAGFRQTVWYTDADRSDIVADDTIEDDMGRHTQRGIYDLGVDLSADFHRIFPVSGFGIEKVKHTMLPQVKYSYIPSVDQSEYPDFDDIDRIEKENRMVFSLTHFFTSRRTVERRDRDPERSYNRFARFMVEQPYDFNYEDRDDALLPIYGEIDITPARILTIHADARYSHQENTFLGGNTSVRLRDIWGSRFRVDYRYARDANESLYFELEVPVRAWLDVYGDYERNLEHNTNVELNAGFRYKADCWSADFSYRAMEDLDGTRDERYFVMVHLYGLGELGN